MKPSQVVSFLTDRINAGILRPVHLESSPGIGKTQLTAQVAAKLGIGFKAIHAPTMQPEDYGFPVINAARTDVSFIVSKAKFPVMGSDCPDKGILLVDELPQGDNATQKVIANLLQEREIHGQRLKPGWFVVTTGNRVTDRAGANRMLGHLRNRLTTIQLDPNIDDWSSWAVDANVPVEVISFLRFRSDLLSQYDPNQEISPTPRGWAEGVGKSFGVVPREMELEAYKGDVGEGPAVEFVAFARICRDLPSVDAILLNPGKHPIPKEPAVLYALTGSLAFKTSESNFEGLTTFMNRMPPEFTVLYMHTATKRCPSVMQTKAFIQWAATNTALN